MEIKGNISAAGAIYLVADSGVFDPDPGEFGNYLKSDIKFVTGNFGNGRFLNKAGSPAMVRLPAELRPEAKLLMPFIRARFLGIATPPDVTETTKMEINAILPAAAQVQALAEQPVIAATVATADAGEVNSAAKDAGSIGAEASDAKAQDTKVGGAKMKAKSRETTVNQNSYANRLTEYMNIADDYTVQCTPEGICLVRTKSIRIRKDSTRSGF
jgi:hypothetical protein